MMSDTNFIYFICSELPQISKYCEAFYNYLTYGYRNYNNNSGYAYSKPSVKKAQSRLLKNKKEPPMQEMKAGDFILDRIYKKVITSDSYLHSYQQITDQDINDAEKIVFITSSKKPAQLPRYIKGIDLHIVIWKLSEMRYISDEMYELLESSVRKMVS